MSLRNHLSASTAIEAIINEYEISENIKLRAKKINSIIIKKVSVGRSSRRDLYLYFLVYCAYLEEGETPDPATIAAMVSKDPVINIPQMRQAHKMYSYPNTDYRIPIVENTSQNFIRLYAESLGLMEQSVQDLYKLYEKWQRSSSRLLKKSSPRVIAATVIKYYMQCHGLHIDESVFAKAVNMKFENISCEELCQVDNKN
jgi:hypothetical protein